MSDQENVTKILQQHVSFLSEIHAYSSDYQGVDLRVFLLLRDANCADGLQPLNYFFSDSSKISSR